VNQTDAQDKDVALRPRRSARRRGGQLLAAVSWKARHSRFALAGLGPHGRKTRASLRLLRSQLAQPESPASHPVSPSLRLVPVLETRLYDREAFRAIFSFGGSVAGLADKSVSNLVAAIRNADAFAGEIVDTLRVGKREAA
jgi:hypothetical protein